MGTEPRPIVAEVRSLCVGMKGLPTKAVNFKVKPPFGSWLTALP